mgnify:CR=1 FL=1
MIKKYGNSSFSILIISGKDHQFLLPYYLHQKMVQIELFKTLYINKLNIVHSKTNKLNSRVIVSYSFHKKEIVENELVIRNSDNTYTSEYIKLTKDFHYNKL